jgi:hypothetical protein
MVSQQLQHSLEPLHIYVDCKHGLICFLMNVTNAQQVYVTRHAIQLIDLYIDMIDRSIYRFGSLGFELFYAMNLSELMDRSLVKNELLQS